MLVTLPQPIFWPDLVAPQNAAFSIGAGNTLDASGEYSAQVFNADQAMTISHIGFNPQASSSGVATVSIQTLDGSGNPSGTLWNAAGGGSTGTTGTLVAGTWALTELAATASITAGQEFAVVITYSSGTSFVVATHTSGSRPQYNTPYRITNTTGAAAQSTSSGLILAVGSSATTFYPLRNTLPVLTVGATAFNNTNGACRAARFRMLFNCRVVGLRYFAGNAATGNHNIVMMDDAGNELSSSSTACVQINAFAGNCALVRHFDNPVTITRNTWYRAVIEPNSATNFNLYSLALPSANYMSAMPGGADYHYATRSSGTWTDSATGTVPAIDLIIDQIDNGQVGVIGG